MTFCSCLTQMNVALYYQKFNFSYPLIHLFIYGHSSLSLPKNHCLISHHIIHFFFNSLGACVSYFDFYLIFRFCWFFLPINIVQLIVCNNKLVIVGGPQHIHICSHAHKFNFKQPSQTLGITIGFVRNCACACALMRCYVCDKKKLRATNFLLKIVWMPN